MSFELWESLYSFQLLLIRMYLTPNVIMQILERKKNISQIKQYRIDHQGKYPSESCSELIFRKLRNYPHPYEYDYDNTSDSNENLEEFYFRDLEQIMESHHKIVCTTRVLKFTQKYLTCFTDDFILKRIGNYYKLFKCEKMLKLGTDRKCTVQLDVKTSKEDSLPERFNRKSQKRPSSILRSSNKRKSYKRKATDGEILDIVTQNGTLFHSKSLLTPSIQSSLPQQICSTKVAPALSEI